MNIKAGLDLATGLAGSLLRQDPQVIMVGEIRDPVTAGIALQASLTGQLVLTTIHAGSAAGAISRLLDMGVEPYVLRSGIQAVVCQRLVRKLCTLHHRQPQPGRKPRIARFPVVGARLLLELSRDGLPRAGIAGRNADDEAAGGAGRGLESRGYRRPGASRARKRHGQPLALGLRGGRGGRNKPRRNSPSSRS